MDAEFGDRMQPGPFEQTTIQGGLPKLLRIWEYLRELNDGGYGSGRLVRMKNGPDKTGNKKTSCSPFTATVIGMALDPREVDTGKPYDLKEPFDPRFNGGEEVSNHFYHLHNSFPVSEYKTKTGAWDPVFKKAYVDRAPNLFKEWEWINHSAGSVVFHNLGVPVDSRRMRRGDVVGIDWMNDGGHAVFCWNVHLDKKGEVDCFQYVSANGASGQGPGVTVIQYPIDKKHLEFDKSTGKYTKVGDMFTGAIDDLKAYPEYVRAPYQWYALRHIEGKEIDKTTFGVPADQVTIVDYKFTWKGNKLGVNRVNVARLHGVVPPEPWLKAGDKSQPDAEPAKPKPVAVAKSTPVAKPKDKKPDEPKSGDEKSADSKKADDKPKDRPKEPKAAPESDVQAHQVEVELYLQELWTARWILSDPGDSANVNDSLSQAAIKDFQTKYMKDQKVPQPGYPDPATRARMAKYAAWALQMPVVNLSLRLLHEHGAIDHAPGDNLLQLDDATLAALKEFQKKKDLDPDGIPGPKTQAALAKAIKETGEKSAEPSKPPPAEKQPAQSKPAGKKKDEPPPAIWDVYFTRNWGKAGDKATVVVVAFNSEKAIFDVGLYSDEKPLVEKAGQVKIQYGKGKLEAQIPSGLAPGTMVEARASGGGLSGATAVPFEVATAEAADESANWRPFVGKPEIPAHVLEAIRQNRAKYPVRELAPVASTSSKYRGKDHYNYDPPADHRSWARNYFTKKLDGASLERKHQIQAYLGMLDHEGLPASMQTYDSQVVTWGVGTGAMGNGKEVFKLLNDEPKIKKLLDDVGIAFVDGDYQVVDLARKKVIGSTEGSKGNDERHRVPLDSWRKQPDLLSAVIAISEDPSYRETIAEAQYKVFLDGAAAWKGQDKIYTRALYFLIVHMRAWYPAFAGAAVFDVNKEFEKLGLFVPSLESDKKLAPVLARLFVRNGKAWFAANKKPDSSYADLRERTRSHLWGSLKSEGAAEGFDPGELTYDFD